MSRAAGVHTHECRRPGALGRRIRRTHPADHLPPHVRTDGAEWRCGGCTDFTSQFTRLDFLDNYDARFVVVTNGPIEEALAYRDKVGNRMDWYSSSESSFGTDVDAAPGGRVRGQRVPACDGSVGRGIGLPHLAHQRPSAPSTLSHSFALIDLLPYGRQEEWLDSPEGWPSRPTYSGWLDSPDIARLYGKGPPMTSSTDTEQLCVVTRTVSASPAPGVRRPGRPGPALRHLNPATGCATRSTHADHRDGPDLRDQHVPAGCRRTTSCTTW